MIGVGCTNIARAALLRGFHNLLPRAPLALLFPFRAESPCHSPEGRCSLFRKTETLLEGRCRSLSYLCTLQSLCCVWRLQQRLFLWQSCNHQCLCCPEDVGATKHRALHLHLILGCDGEWGSIFCSFTSVHLLFLVGPYRIVCTDLQVLSLLGFLLLEMSLVTKDKSSFEIH